MTEKDILDMMIKVIVSSLPGFFSYFYLQKVNVLNLNKNSDEENKQILLFFSVVNLGIGLILFSWKQIDWLPILAKSVLIVTVLIILTMYVFPFIMKQMGKLINDIRDDSNFGEFTYESDWKVLMTTKTSKRISIFSFEGKHIISGFTDRVPDDIQFDYFMLIMKQKGISTNETTKEEEVVIQYQTAEQEMGGKYSVLVDMEKKYKIHIYDELKKKGKDC